MNEITEKEILKQCYQCCQFQNLSIREKIKYLELEKEKLVNIQNRSEEKQSFFQKIKINNNYNT